MEIQPGSPFFDSSKQQSMLTASQELNFLTEIDKLKNVFRQSLLTDFSRRENSAEHSWHLAMAVVVLKTYANEPLLNMEKVITMALIHDIVEIDAGDTYAYDAKANEGKFDREMAAANRIYGLLPDIENNDLKELWLEFEARQTPEAIFVDAVDRFMPMMLNYLTQGRQWLAHGVTRQIVEERNHVISQGSEKLWQIAQNMLIDAENKGYLKS